ncbi:retrovirus-related pol polyprotein from transposon TNT 1-94 [Tanacetum coccineum]
MYVEQGRGNNFRGRGFGRSVVVEITMKKGNNETGFNKIIEEEDMMTVEKVVHTIVTIMAGHFARECIFPKRVEETTNLVTKEDVKVGGIVMMAYEVELDGTEHEEMKEVVDGLVMVGDELNVRVKKESAWDLIYKNVNHRQEEHDYKPRNLAYYPQTTYEICECSNTLQQNHIPDNEEEPRKPRMRSMQYLYDSTIDMNYDEVFSPVARIKTIRLLISHAAQMKWQIYQMNMKFAFLNNELEEEVYSEQPLGFMKAGKETQVHKQNKALHGLKQAWNTRIDLYLKKNKCLQCPYEHALYVKKDGKKLLFVALYVDDIIFMGNDGKW